MIVQCLVEGIAPSPNFWVFWLKKVTAWITSKRFNIMDANWRCAFFHILIVISCHPELLFLSLLVKLWAGIASWSRRRSVGIVDHSQPMWKSVRVVLLLTSVIEDVSAWVGDFTKLIARNQRRSPVQPLDLKLSLSINHFSFVSYVLLCWCLLFRLLLSGFRRDSLCNSLRCFVKRC